MCIIIVMYVDICSCDMDQTCTPSITITSHNVLLHAYLTVLCMYTYICAQSSLFFLIHVFSYMTPLQRIQCSN